MPQTSAARRASANTQLAPNLTPMLDVVLQLITFFMMLVHFGTRVEGQTELVRLPVAPAALPTTDLSLDRLVLAVDRGGRLLVGNNALDATATEQFLTAEASARRSGMETLGGPVNELPTQVVLRVDESARYGMLRQLLTIAQTRGFARFSLVLIRGEAP